MCGIFAVYRDHHHQAAETILTGLKKLEYRGYDSWGIATASLKNQADSVKQIGKIGDVQLQLAAADMGIGHTRWATHGGVTIANAHPHWDCAQDIALVHNGIVENHISIKERLVRSGHKFTSETDSEVIVHLIEFELKKAKNFRLAVFEAFRQLEGMNAIVAMQASSLQIVACKLGSPLVLGIKPKTQYLASDVPALLEHTRKVIYLSDGQGVHLADGAFTMWDIKEEAVMKVKAETVTWSAESADKGDFPYYMIKEIHEQQISIPRAFNLNQAVLRKLAKTIKQGCPVILLGCGTAYYCALSAKYLFAMVGVESQAYAANEFLPFEFCLKQKTLVFAISQSGETVDTVLAARLAKQQGSTVVAVVNARGSTLERFADIVLPVGAGPEISVVSTKAFTAQLALFQSLIGILNSKIDHMKTYVKQFSNWIETIPEKKIKQLARKLRNHEHAYVIGKHLNFPAALEFALKLKETCYIHAEGFAAGELKHGVISLVETGTICFALTSDDHARNDTVSGAIELKTRGATIIGVGPFQEKVFDYWLPTPNVGSFTPMANIMIGQLLAYHIALEKGCDPDKPRNLAKSVTVK